MRIFSHKGTYEVQETQGQIITLPVAIAKSGSGDSQFVRVDGMLDSGCTGIVIPQALAQEIGITNSDIMGEAVAETAGGDVATAEIKINLQIRCEPSGQMVLLEDFPASVTKSETVLIGNSVLQHFDVLLKSGQLALLALADLSKRKT